MSRSATILIVEDERLTAHMSGAILEREGYAVTIVDSAFQAQEILRLQKFDLVLLDLYLPGVTGWDLLPQLRHQYPLADLPIVILSSEGSTQIRARVLELGASDFVTKPATAELLIKLVSYWIGRTAPKKRNIVSLSDDIAAKSAKPSIFVVDDDPLLAPALEPTLENAGFRVEAVHSVTAFVRHLDSVQTCGTVAALMVDMCMPEQDGFDLMRELAFRNIKIPLVLITSIDRHYLAVAKELARAWGLDVIDTMMKPLAPNQLSLCLRKILLGAAPVREAIAKPRILVAEDEALVRYTIADSLRTNGFQVLEARNGLEALELLRGPEEIDVLLTDLDMPEMNGMTLALKVEELRPKTRIIFMSGRIDSPPMANAIFIPKPFRTADLTNIITREWTH